MIEAVMVWVLVVPDWRWSMGPFATLDDCEEVKEVVLTESECQRVGLTK